MDDPTTTAVHAAAVTAQLAGAPITTPAAARQESHERLSTSRAAHYSGVPGPEPPPPGHDLGPQDVRGMMPNMFHFAGMGASRGGVTMGDGYTITLQAQNRLVECDALCTAVTRSVHAADQRDPVRILGLRASSTIVRTAFVLLVSGATTVLRAAASG